MSARVIRQFLDVAKLRFVLYRTELGLRIQAVANNCSLREPGQFGTQL